MEMVKLGMTPEDITGIDARGFLIHVAGCSCEYNEIRHAAKSGGGFMFTTQQLVSIRDAACSVHRSVA